MTVDAGAHLLTTVLPWWEGRALDGLPGVRTCFTNRGELLSADRVTWSQGRWAWVAAELALDGGSGRLPVAAAEWAERSRSTALMLARRARMADGRTHFRLTAEGVPPAGMPADESAASVFADLFAVLGISAALRAPAVPGGGAEAETEAETEELRAAAAHILSAASAAIAAGTARTEPYPVPAGFRDLASPMTLLHTASEAQRAGVPGAREIAHSAWSELLGEGGLLSATSWWEFRPDAEADRDTLLARHVTPGHLLELAWMIEHAAEADPALETPAWLPDLALRALELGWDAEHGGVLRYVDREAGGEPRGRRLDGDRYEDLVTATWDTKLWWVQVESLYAARMLGERHARADLIAWADRIAAYTFATFPDPEGAEWLQIRTRSGEPLDAVVALPVKDPFHIIRALLLLNRLGTAPAV